MSVLKVRHGLARDAASSADAAKHSSLSCNHRCGLGNANASSERSVERTQSDEPQTRAGDLTNSPRRPVVLCVILIAGLLRRPAASPSVAQIRAMGRIDEGPPASVGTVAQPKCECVLRAARRGKRLIYAVLKRGLRSRPR